MIHTESDVTRQGEVSEGAPPYLGCADNSIFGRFLPSVLHIRANSFADLEPEHDDSGPRAISTHAHEYVHYLHSIGTTAGQLYLLSHLILLRYAASGTNQSGHFLGLEALDEPNRGRLIGILRCMQELRGQKKIAFGTIIGRLEFDPPRRIQPADSAIIEVERLAVVARGIRSDGTVVTDEMEIAYSFVTEGVAYAVDREIRRLQGKELPHQLDAHVPLYPYRAYGELIDAWVGRETSVLERILIGNAALGHRAVGITLQRACEAVRQSERPAEEVLAPIIEEGLEESKAVIEKLGEVMSTTAADPMIAAGLSAYLQLVDRASFCRRRLLAPERLLIEKPLDVEGFRRVVGNLVDAMVLQEKPKAKEDGEAELTIDWIGPGHVANDEYQVSGLAALQSAFHFNSLHHGDDGTMAPTSSIAANVCPYKGACEVKVSEDQAELCVSAPWMMFVDSKPGTSVCWYAAGVKTARRAELGATSPTTPNR